MSAAKIVAAAKKKKGSKWNDEIDRRNSSVEEAAAAAVSAAAAVVLSSSSSLQRKRGRKRPKEVTGVTESELPETGDESRANADKAIDAFNTDNNSSGGGKSRVRKKQRKQAEKHEKQLLSVAQSAIYTGSVMIIDPSQQDRQQQQQPVAGQSLSVTTSSCRLPQTQSMTPSSLSVSGLNPISLPSSNHMSSSSPTTTTTTTTIPIRIVTQPLLVLDLNGILCHRVRKHKEPPAWAQIPYRAAQSHIAGTPVIGRPHLESFLHYLDAHFCLAVWTSAKSKTAKGLVEALVPPAIRERLLFVWGQNKCQEVPVLPASSQLITATTQTTTMTENSSSNNNNMVFEKDLTKVWNEFPLWNRSNTLLLDDSPEKCDSFRQNALHPPPMHGRQLLVLQQGLRHQQKQAIAAFFQKKNSNNCGNDNDDDAMQDKILSDETNHELQMQFFTKLVDFWKDDTSHNVTNEVNGTSTAKQDQGDMESPFNNALGMFLQQSAADHMGWRAV